MPFNDRDFTSVAELLLVPGCPPGLFTKQFVEEPYPGNVATQLITVSKVYPTSGNGTVTYSTSVSYYNPNNPNLPPALMSGTYAKGTDNGTFAATIVAPNVSTTTGPTTTTSGTNSIDTTTILTRPVGGRTDFNEMNITGAPSTPVAPTFPYLPDNFYYTAAAVAPPLKPQNGYPPYYTNLTTEIGGWTGTGWYKMLEFFEVPSSANGSIGTADSGTNFDWARADIKPGLLNLNLIIDEEVFFGLIDDPRLNERLARYAPGPVVNDPPDRHPGRPQRLSPRPIT